MLNDRGHLAIAVIIFYVFGLPVSTYVAIRHGFGRHLGWFYLVSLPVVRLIGNILTVVAEEESHPSTGLLTTAAILSAIGLVPLLLALLGLLNRANQNMSVSHVPQQAWRIIHLINLVGLILSIVGGIESTPSNSASEIHTSITLRKAGAVLLAVTFLLLALAALATVARIRHVWSGDRKLVYAAVACLPFLAIRDLYSLLVSFDGDSSTFARNGPNVWVEAFMQICMEFIVFIIFTTAGLLTPRADKSVTGPTRVGHRGDTEFGNVPAQPQGYRAEQHAQR